MFEALIRDVLSIYAVQMLYSGYAGSLNVTHAAVIMGSFQGGRGRASRPAAMILALALPLWS